MSKDIDDDFLVFYNSLSKYKGKHFEFKEEKKKYNQWQNNITLEKRHFEKFQECDSSFFKNLIKYFVSNIESGNFTYKKVKPMRVSSWSTVSHSIHVFDKENLLKFQISTGNINSNYSSDTMSTIEPHLKINKYDLESRKSVESFKFKIPNKIFRQIIKLCEKKYEECDYIEKIVKINDITREWRYDMFNELKGLGSECDRSLKFKLIFGKSVQESEDESKEKES
jgi:hypothetical protein